MSYYIDYICISIIIILVSVLIWWPSSLSATFYEGFTDGIPKLNMVAISKNDIQADNAMLPELNKIKLSPTLVSQLMPCKNRNLALAQYCIKGSYNTGYISYSSLSYSGIKYVLSRGCRFLDFEVYSTMGNSGTPTAVVSHKNAKNALLLADVFSVCLATAFASALSPTYSDPLFLHLRLGDTSKDTVGGIVSAIRGIIVPSGKMYKNPAGNASVIDANTVLALLCEKVIIVFDISTNSGKMPSELVPFVNIQSGGITGWQKVSSESVGKLAIVPPNYEDISGNIIANVNALNMVYPASETVPMPVFGATVANYGFQTMLMPFYSRDPNISGFETAFNNLGGSCVPISYALNYFSNSVVSKK